MSSPTFFFFLSEVGIKVRASSLLGKHVIIWITSLAIFALVIFQIGPCFHAQVSLDCDPIYTSCIAGITGTCHSTQSLVEMGCCELFCGLAWNHHPPDLCLLSS
jgi:hypothetical protein